MGFEPTKSCLEGRCTNHCATSADGLVVCTYIKVSDSEFHQCFMYTNHTSYSSLLFA